MNASLFVLTIASLAAAPQDVLYDFYSTSCGPCQMMMPIVERLHAEGLPVKTIDIGQRPDLADRFGVHMVPTFVLVVGGQERERQVGTQDESTLRALLAQIPRRPAPAQVADSSPPPRPHRSLPVRLADDDSQGSKWNFHLPLPSFSGRSQSQQQVVQIDPPSRPAGSGAQATVTDAGMKDAIADATTPSGAMAGDDSPRDERTNGERTSADREGEPRSSADPVASTMLASSVRIRVKDANGAYFGSGVVIDSTPGKTLVLTCGHILRDVKEGTRIEVDVFDGKRSRTYHGSIVKFDLEADLGLIAVATRSAVAVSPVASAEGAVRPRDVVVSIGCTQGELPSVERLRVTMLNRYLGPDTIECTGVPGQGRSGGGLFTAHGSVVGICTNADPQSRRGVYAGLKPIHDLLKSAGLDELIPSPPKVRRDSLAEAGAVKTEPTAAEDPSRVKVDRDMEAPPPARVRPTSAKAAESLAGQPANEGELSPKVLEQSEVICNIRPVNQPKGASRVVIINRASRKFMAYLTGEMKDPLMPAMGHSPRDDGASVTSTEDGHVTAASGADPGDSSRSTAVWKPSTSAR
jgi:thiol-disulfide isomerase/thioredoxin